MSNINFDAVIKALNKNNIDAVFAKDCKDAQSIVENMLFEGCNISSGGSMSLIESGIFELINSPRYNFKDRNRKGITEEEKTAVYKDIIDIDFYFSSSNAVTENGELLNVDGFANRVSAIAFGPKKVIMIVGRNKIVSDLEAAAMRVKTIAAPKNCVRLKLDTPCAKLGHCISLEGGETPKLTDGCSSDSRICISYLVSARQRQKGRITVILVDEDLGY